MKRRKGNQHLQPVLVECAWAAARHHGYLKSPYHRHLMKWAGYRSQLAKKKAIIVVAHAILVIIWHVLATGKPYDELGEDYFTRRADPERETRRLVQTRSSRPHSHPGSGRQTLPASASRRTNRAGCCRLPGWGPFTDQDHAE